MLRRAQPLLGTLVEIACETGDDTASVEAASDTARVASTAGFAAVARIHALMSRHEAMSDLSQFNAAPLGQWTQVAPETLEVFLFALQLSHQTGGIFDVCAIGIQDTPGSWRDIEIDLARSSLRKHAPLQADLGGIAKGYAVDAGVNALQAAGAQRGSSRTR